MTASCPCRSLSTPFSPPQMRFIFPQAGNAAIFLNFFEKFCIEMQAGVHTPRSSSRITPRKHHLQIEKTSRQTAREKPEGFLRLCPTWDCICRTCLEAPFIPKIFCPKLTGHRFYLQPSHWKIHSIQNSTIGYKFSLIAEIWCEAKGTHATLPVSLLSTWRKTKKSVYEVLSWTPGKCMLLTEIYKNLKCFGKGW